MFKTYTVIKNDSNKHHEISYHCLENRNSIGFVSFLFCDKASRKMIKRGKVLFLFLFLIHNFRGHFATVWKAWNLEFEADGHLSSVFKKMKELNTCAQLALAFHLAWYPSTLMMELSIFHIVPGNTDIPEDCLLSGSHSCHDDYQEYQDLENSVLALIMFATPHSFTF